MAVTFTTNIGLAKPSETELAKNWVNVTQLQDDNNQIIINKANIGISTYTPVLVGQTTAPGVGAGSITGQYQSFQGFIWGSVLVEFLTAGIIAGSGEFGFSLPFPADNTYHNVGSALNAAIGTFSCIGEGYIYDDSATDKSGTVALDVVTIAGVSYARMITETFSSPVKTGSVYAAGMPTSVADKDKWNCSFFYKNL